MFEIEYKGGNTVIINTKKEKIVVDPKMSVVGLKDINTTDGVELATEERFAVNNQDAALVIDGPGEYGIAGVHIYGMPARRHIDDEKSDMQSTIYRIEIGDARLGVLGNISSKLSDEQLEQLGVIDILILPVGGNGYTLDANDAAAMVRSIDPKIVIPVHYADSALKYEVPQDSLAAFVSEMGAPVETVSKFKLKQYPIAQESLSIVEITRS